MRKALLLALALTASGLAQTHLTLKEAVQRSVRCNPSMLRQLALAQAAEAARDRVESDLYPHLNLEAVGKTGPPGAPNFRLPGLTNAGFAQSAGGDLIFLQTFDFGRTSQRLLAQQHLSQAAQEESQLQRARLSLNAVRAYGEVLLTRDLLALALQTETTRSALVRQTLAHYRAGLVSRVDNGLAQADLAQAQSETLELKGGLQSAQATLWAAMGEPNPPSLDLQLETLPAPLEEWPTSLDQDLAAAQAARPELKATHHQVEAAQASLGMAQSGYNPSLNFYAAGGYIANLNGPASTPNTYGVGLALTVPVFSAGGVQAEIRQEDSKLAAALAAEQEVLQKVQLEVQQARIRFVSQRERRPALEQQDKAAQDSVKLASTRYRLGLGNLLEVQQAELTRVRSASLLLRNRAEIWLAWLELLYVTGHLFPDFVEAS